MTYDHRQNGKLHLSLLAPIFLFLLPVWQFRATPGVLLVAGAITLLLIFVALCFEYLLVLDEGDCLTLRYGPIPLFHKRFFYSQMTGAEPSRSNILDGWGIHYMPGRGWIYNLWGCDCVKVQMGKKTVRIGTDDVEGLMAMLRGKFKDAEAQMTEETRPRFETDERLPTGEWKGFWLQRPHFKSRQWMELMLSFADGKITGDGSDSIGRFAMRGQYDLKTGKVVIHKSYVGKHHVLYEGWAELDRGVWGMWTIPGLGKDGFHIWPKGMKDPTGNELKAEVSEPLAPEARPVLVKG